MKEEVNRLALRKNVCWRNKHNITQQQRYLLDFFYQHPDFVVVQSDKNLGLIMMERADYIRMMLNNHLCKASRYQRLGPG